VEPPGKLAAKLDQSWLDGDTLLHLNGGSDRERRALT
jgi:hypothetical protein